MSMSPQGEKEIGCDGMCYGCNLHLPKGHPDRKEICPIAEKCSYNPNLYKEWFWSIFTIPILIFSIGLIIFFIFSF